MPVWEAGDNEEGLRGWGGCFVWVGVFGDIVGIAGLAFKGAAGDAKCSVLSGTAHDNHQHPQTETLFKGLGLTSQEAIRGGEKAPNPGGL